MGDLRSKESKLLFERSVPGRFLDLIPDCDVPERSLPEGMARSQAPRLPELSENDISRHYTELAKKTFGINDGMYPLGSCTMKYNPKVDDEMANLPGFIGLHPYQPGRTVEGAEAVMDMLREYLCEITGMEDMTFQPAAGSHGEFTGLLMIKAYHKAKGEEHRNEIIVPDSAHGTNPASCTMANYKAVSIPSDEYGCVDLEALKAAVNENTAGLMLTNPNTLGIFDRNILEITKIVHDAGGLCYYDGANLNAIMGQVRPGDMGFDVIHLNLHKTFATPHGGGGPGAGAVGCKDFLANYFPKVRSYHGNFGVVIRALCYVMSLGKSGVPETSANAVLNANYMKAKLKDTINMANSGLCMHEFVASLTDLKSETGVSALDVSKMMLDYGIHPATMYFPLIVDEALMFEPTETESKDTLDRTINVIKEIVETAHKDPEKLHEAPHTTVVRRLDEVKAAREPKLKYEF